MSILLYLYSGFLTALSSFLLLSLSGVVATIPNMIVCFGVIGWGIISATNRTHYTCIEEMKVAYAETMRPYFVTALGIVSGTLLVHLAK